MTRIERVLAAAPVALALLMAAPPAPAITTFSEFKCEEPTASDEDLTAAVAASSVRRTANYEDEDCKKLCGDLRKLCDANARERAKCIKDDDKAFLGIQKRQCGINSPEDNEPRKECEKATKEDEDECKAELKELLDDARDDCDDRFGDLSTCEQTCLASTFPFSP